MLESFLHCLSITLSRLEERDLTAKMATVDHEKQPYVVDKLGGSGSNSENSGEALGVNESKLLRKIDWHIVPGVTLLYLLSFLDRSNIANARLEGLATDLKISKYHALKPQG